MNDLMQTIVATIPNTEKLILDQLGRRVREQKYEFTDDQLQCVQTYDRSAIAYGLVNVVGWSWFSWKAFAPRNKKTLPTWLLMYGLLAVTGGAFSTVWISSKYAARSCVQCLLDVKDKKNEMYLALKGLVKEHHPQSKAFFEREKYRLNSEQATRQIESAASAGNS